MKEMSWKTWLPHWSNSKFLAYCASFRKRSLKFAGHSGFSNVLESTLQAKFSEI
jgi:hypothetical protein